MQHESEALNFRRALTILRRRLPLVLFCALLVGGAALAYSKNERKEYTATSSIVFSNSPLTQQVLGLTPSSTGSQFTQQASNVELVGLGDMAARTASQLGGGLTEEKVRESIHVAGQGESDVVAISATAPSPTLAARMANTYARDFVGEQRGSNDRYYKSALALVNRQLGALPKSERFGPAAVALQTRSQTLRLLEELHYDNVQIAGKALAPSSPSSPKTAKNTVVGLMLGLLIGVALAFVLERFDRDRRIREPEDFEAVYQLPVLAEVPDSAALATPKDGNSFERQGLPLAEIEVFQMARARLRFLYADRSLCTIMVTAAARGEGTTTISRYLAEAAARAGARTLLLEGDLREPSLGRLLGLKAGVDLADVLVGGASADVAIKSVELGGGGASRVGGVIDVLACSGPGSALNSVALLESPAMDAMLEYARQTYDLVVIDTPPLTAYSDAFSLVHKVDGVLIVGSLATAKRKPAEELGKTLESSEVPQLGVIANRAQRRGGRWPIRGKDRADRAGRIPISSSNGKAPEAPVPTLEV